MTLKYTKYTKYYQLNLSNLSSKIIISLEPYIPAFVLMIINNYSITYTQRHATMNYSAYSSNFTRIYRTLIFCTIIRVNVEWSFNIDMLNILDQWLELNSRHFRLVLEIFVSIFDSLKKNLTGKNWHDWHYLMFW